MIIASHRQILSAQKSNKALSWQRFYPIVQNDLDEKICP
jgi:hypothetical protein